MLGWVRTCSGHYGSGSHSPDRGERFKGDLPFRRGSTVIAAAILWITVKNVPEEIGLSPYLTSADEKKGIRQYGEDLPCRTGILLLVAMFMHGFVCNSFTAQISSVFIEKGYTPLQASYLVSIMGIALVIGKLVYGKATDCFGTFGVALLFHVFLFVGCAFYSSAIPYYSLGVTAMIFGGMGEAIGSVGITALAYEFSSRETFVVNLKRMQLISMIGGMCGGVLPGIIADVTGYYRPITHVFMAATLLNLTCLLTIKKVRGRI